VLADPAAARCPEARPDKAKMLVITTTEAAKPLLLVPLIGVTLVFISSLPSRDSCVLPPTTIEEGTWKRLEGD
jgi:hypothetical protein